LLTPTQLLIQGQWWSNLSIHLLHTEQCLDLVVRIIKQSGHNYALSTTSNNSIKSTPSLFIYPGLLQTETDSANTQIEVIIILAIIYQSFRCG